MIGPHEEVVIEPPVSDTIRASIIDNFKRQEAVHATARTSVGATACWRVTPESEMTVAKVYIRPKQPQEVS